MKLCPYCNASNINSSEFCTECGRNLADVPAQAGNEAPPPPGNRIVFPDKQPPSFNELKSLLSSAETLDMEGGRGRNGLMFILDFTGNAVGKADVIGESVRSFVDWLRGAGFVVRVGAVEFRGQPVDENGDP